MSELLSLALHLFIFWNLLGLSKDFHSPILAVTIVTQQINS